MDDGAYSTTDAYLPSIAADDGGIIYIAWKGTGGIYFDKSTDDGSSFSVDIRIDNTTDSSYQTDPSIAVGDHGRVTIAWEDNRNGNYNIYCAGITTTPAGDLNHDGVIAPADAVIALQLAATGGRDRAADVDGDNHITSLDALMILQAAAGRLEL